jgi:hypothetical protein
MKINIENYENMTPEEKLAALEAYDPEKDGFVSKTLFDKTSSEAANYKKQLREKQSDEEAKAQKEAEERAALVSRVAELEKEKTINGYVNSFLSLGYDEKTAKETAEALATGDMDLVFMNQKKFTENREKLLRAELLKETPPPAGGKTVTKTREEILKMTLAEQAQFAAENPEEYKKIYGGN